MAYKPKLTDPRVYNRVVKSLGFVRSCFSADKPRSWSSRHIAAILGNTSRNPGRWLKHRLLIATSENYSSDHGTCKAYKLNTQGYQDLMDQVSALSRTPIDDQTLIDAWIQNTYGQELSVKQFNYKTKSHRKWHGLQNIRREPRARALKSAGFAHEYDIIAAAPTLLYQSAKNQNSRKKYPTLERFLADRHHYRNYLATELDLDISVIKGFLSALFCGARLSADFHSAIYELMEADAARITWLKQDAFITGLRKDIKKLWSTLKPQITPRVTINPRTHEKKISNRLNARQKWEFYFQMEEQVMSVVTDFLDESGIKYFQIHDGWVSEYAVSVSELELLILHESGYRVMIDKK